MIALGGVPAIRSRAIARLALGLFCVFQFALLPSCSLAESGAPPTGLDAVWQSFRDAVRKGDAAALARISHFPIRSNDFGGDIPSEKVLGQRFHKIFFAAVRTCIESKKPAIVSGSPGYLVDCDNDNLALGFGFEIYGKEYRFSYIDNANAE